MTDINTTLTALTTQLRQLNIEQPTLEARLLLQHVLSYSAEQLLQHWHQPVTVEMLNVLQDLIARRVRGEPLSRIKGEREFWSLPFAISMHTLDPRPDTEILVQAVIDDHDKMGAYQILDLGTGSGCILLSLLHTMSNSHGIGVDLQAEALKTAALNAQRLHLDQRVVWLESNWCDRLTSQVFDIIVSNPPYIAETTINHLAPAVKDFDPYVALSGGTDGLRDYRVLLQQLKTFCAPHTQVYLEMGYDQQIALNDLCASYGWSIKRWIKDFAGHTRVVVIKPQ